MGQVIKVGILSYIWTKIFKKPVSDGQRHKEKSRDTKYIKCGGENGSPRWQDLWLVGEEIGLRSQLE